MQSLRRTLLLSWLVCCAGTCGAAPPPARELSMDQAVKNVERQYHARVVKAETQHEGERTTYVLRLLDEAGKVWTVRVDAASGAVQ
ncbi:MAG TPA: PepSY domain-containing protein [Steroidobacteraceae bacterium]|nr:PepSY domain-containing protein [Steroidobacteraceae bacterium]